MAEKTTSTTKGKKRRDISTFEFCDVCNRNHDQGNRHKYSSSHSRALSSLLSRFHKKVTDIRFFLRNPSVLPPEHAELNRIWCVVCGLDVHEVGSSFACSNALSHLASVEHLKNLKDFLWKHGGGMDRVDSFRVSETDLMKWEKGCRALKCTSSTMNEGSIGPSKEMRGIEYVIKRLMDPQLPTQFPPLLLFCMRACREMKGIGMLSAMFLLLLQVSNIYPMAMMEGPTL